MHRVTLSELDLLKPEIRYQDYLSWRWVWLHAPLLWHGNVDLIFRTISFAALEKAGNFLDPSRIGKWLGKLERGDPIPPLIVFPTKRGSFYIRDGNHCHEALRRFLGTTAEHAKVRVAVAVPKPGFQFRYRQYCNYGTYVLGPQHSPRLSSGRGSGLISNSQIDKPDPVPQIPLFGRALILVAHPDDETACATLLQRAYESVVIFCTDGAPSPEFFWRNYGSREGYAAIRCQEAARALSIVGIGNAHFLRDRLTQQCFEDQQLFRRISSALEVLLEYVPRIQSDALIAPAYEGGHPDHDACSLLACLLGRKLNIPIWEMPLYYRSQSGLLLHQQFINANGTELVLYSTPAELSKRREMFSAYASQPDASEFVSSPVELFRPQPAYDYSRPPHVGPLNYEAWRWPMSSMEVCAAFQFCLASYAATNLPSDGSAQRASLDILKHWHSLWTEGWNRGTTLITSKWVWTTLGAVLCTGAAGFLTLLGPGSFETFFPLLFLCVIVFIAATFGKRAGILGTIVAAIIFAEFLFDPTLSLKVHDPAQRSTLIWMIIGGIAMSELLGTDPRQTRKKTV